MGKNQRAIDYAVYNIWANNRLIDRLLSQKDELMTEELVASFPSIRATVLHIWYAEMGWYSRLKGLGWETTRVVDFNGENEELYMEWQQTSGDFKNFVQVADLEKEVVFEHKGERFSIPGREIVHTVFTHGSYHRGQVVMMMRQLGISDIPQTDYIEWVREKARTRNAIST